MGGVNSSDYPASSGGGFVLSGVLATGITLLLPALPPHLPGLALGAAVGGLVAGARTKARFGDSVLLGGLTGLGVALLTGAFLGIVKLVRMSVPAASVSGTIVAQLHLWEGLLIAAAVAAYAAVTATAGAVLGGWLARRGKDRTTSAAP